MENNKAYKTLASHIRNFEEQLSWCHQANKDYDQYIVEAVKQIEIHFAECVNALAARKEKLLKELEEKSKEQKKRVEENRAKLVSTLVECQETLEEGSHAYSFNQEETAEVIWQTLPNTVVQVSKNEITAYFPPELLESIENHGEVKTLSMINFLKLEPVSSMPVHQPKAPKSNIHPTPTLNAHSTTKLNAHSTTKSNAHFISQSLRIRFSVKRQQHPYLDLVLFNLEQLIYNINTNKVSAESLLLLDQCASAFNSHNLPAAMGGRTAYNKK